MSKLIGNDPRSKKSGRRVLSEQELAASLRYRGNFFELYEVKTSAGPREVIRRRNGNSTGAKLLPLFVDKKIAKKIDVRGRCSLKEFKKLLKDKKIRDNIRIGFIAIDRPITYFEYPGISISENFVYEIPGGIIDANESARKAAVREAKEEAAVHRLCSTTLSTFAPYDSGSHVELTQLEVAICLGKMRPTIHEGIIPKKCKLIHWKKVPSFVRKCQDKNILVDGIALHAYYQMFF